MKNYTAVIITGIIFFIVSIGCIFFPHKIQNYVVNNYDRGSGLSKINPFIEYIKGKRYITTLRIIGVSAFILFMFIIYLIIKEIIV